MSIYYLEGHSSYNFSPRGGNKDVLPQSVLDLVMERTHSSRCSPEDIRLGSRVLDLLQAVREIPPVLTLKAKNYRDWLWADIMQREGEE